MTPLDKIKKIVCHVRGHKLTARAFSFDGVHRYCERCKNYIRLEGNIPPMPKENSQYADDTSCK